MSVPVTKIKERNGGKKEKEQEGRRNNLICEKSFTQFILIQFLMLRKLKLK